ncbi:MAG: hypothetical protein ACREA9_11125, partial [Pyrinomonadaceae bacterium]
MKVYKSTEILAMHAASATFTPPTQWATRTLVTVRVVAVVLFDGGGSFSDEDTVADGDPSGRRGRLRRAATAPASGLR